MTLDLSYGCVDHTDDGLDVLGRPRWFVRIDGRRWPIEDLGHRFHPQVREWNAKSIEDIEALLRWAADNAARQRRRSLPIEDAIRLAMLQACFHLRVEFVARFESVVAYGLRSASASDAHRVARERQTLLTLIRCAFELGARRPGAPLGPRAA